MNEKMNYKIIIAALGYEDFIPISASDFDSIVQRNKELMFALGFEEKIYLLLKNYREFEKCLFDISFDYMASPTNTEDIFLFGWCEVNLRIANLMTTARLYVDQVRKELKNEVKNHEILAYFEKLTNCECDNNLSYRFMEQLRNHIQHKGLPIHRMNLRSRRDDLDKTSFICFNIIPFIRVDELERDDGLKKTIVKELHKMKDDKGCVNLALFIREYIDSLVTIYAQMKEKLEPLISDADKTIYNHLEKAKTIFSKDIGLSAVAFDENDNWIQEEPINVTKIEQRKILENRNKITGKFSTKYISTKTE